MEEHVVAFAKRAIGFPSGASSAQSPNVGGNGKRVKAGGVPRHVHVELAAGSARPGNGALVERAERGSHPVRRVDGLTSAGRLAGVPRGHRLHLSISRTRRSQITLLSMQFFVEPATGRLLGSGGFAARPVDRAVEIGYESPLSSGVMGSGPLLPGRWSSVLSPAARSITSSRIRGPVRTRRRACSCRWASSMSPTGTTLRLARSGSGDGRACWASSTQDAPVAGVGLGECRLLMEVSPFGRSSVARDLMGQGRSSGARSPRGRNGRRRTRAS